MPPLRGLERKGTWPYLSLPVVAKSGSHNLDAAPYLARQGCRGKSASTSTYGDGAPFRFGGERRLHKEQIEATHTHNDFTQLRAARMRKTLLLLVWLIRVLALERKKLQ